MNIVGKSAIIKNQLENSIRDGFKSVELQILNEFDTLSEYDLLKIIIDTPGLLYPSIHTPLTGGMEATLIEDICDPDKIEPIIKTLSLAQEVAKLQGQTVKVVFHSLIRADQAHELLPLIPPLLKLYPDIEISIENTCPIAVEEGKLFNRPVYSHDTEDLVRFLRENLNTTKIGYTLDICHILSEARIIDSLEMETGVTSLSLQGYFSRVNDIIDNIHFSNSTGLGILPKTHGTPYQSEDIPLLKEICEAYARLDSKPNCVLELCEDDYEVNSNLNKLITIETIKSLGYEIKGIRNYNIRRN